MKDNPNEELKNIAPLLGEMKRKQNFKVPPNYFETLPDVVMEKVTEKAPISIQKQRNAWQKITYIVAIAATMSGVFFGWKQFQPVVSPLHASVTPVQTLAHNETIAPLPIEKVALTTHNLQHRNKNIALLPDKAIYEYIHKNINDVEDTTLEHLLTDDDMEIAYFLDDSDIRLDINDDSL
jgi:hypothetical protein